MTTRTVTRHRRLPAGDDAGFSTIEVVLLAPVFLLLVLLVVGLGRVEQARLQVTGAARDAARAASLTRTPADATSQARTSVDVALTGQKVTCTGGPRVDVQATRFTPGGAVTVTVTCTALLADLTFPGLPGTKTVTATATSSIDTYRSDT